MNALGRHPRLAASPARIRLISLLALSALCPSHPSAAELARIESGTLVVAVRWRLGIVVCADRRRLVESDGKLKYRDDVQKIVPAPPFGLAVTYGTTI